MTDNFVFWRNYLLNNLPIKYDPLSEIYFTIHLIKRNKDNKEGTYLFNKFYIDSVSGFDNLKDNIIKECNNLNLRAYISVSPKSKIELLKSISKLSLSHLCNDEWEKPWNIQNHCDNMLNAYKNNDVWIVDIDSKDEDYYNKVVRVISECKNKYNNPLIDTVNTKNGYHLLTKPFSLNDYDTIWEREFPDLEKPVIKKNRISLLYENLK